MRDPGPRPTNAEMAQLVAILEDDGFVEVYIDDEGGETYRLTEDGVRVGNMLAMVEGHDADAVLTALLGSPATPSLRGTRSPHRVI